MTGSDPLRAVFFAVAVAGTALCLALGAPSLAAAKDDVPEDLPEKYRAWITEVDLLITKHERESFLALEEDYQREAFIETFWRARDPYPETPRNEFREEWKGRVDEARQRFGTLTEDDRAKILLLNGLPDGTAEPKCSDVIWPTEVWYYAKGNRTGVELYLIFYQRWSRGPYRLWSTFEGPEALMRSQSVATPGGGSAFRTLQRSCAGADALLAALSNAYRHGRLGYPLLLMRAQRAPEPPSEEWLATFSSYSTDLPEGAGTFPAEVELSFPGRRQSRTVVQGTVAVETEHLAAATFGEASSYNLVAIGEVLREGQLFDRFRYKFDIPTSRVEGDRVPVVFQRFLRPGEYRLVLKVEDVNGERAFRTDELLRVPVAEGEPQPPPDEETAAILAEANAAISTLDTTVQIVEPPGEMQVGKVRFDVLVTGDDVEGVEFSLDGTPIMRKSSAPFSVELDLGQLPHSQTLRAAALDAEGRELASDELLLNASAHRFAVTLVKPQPGESFRQSVRVEAEVETPEGQVVDRLEIFLDETLVATLYQPPWEHPVQLPEPGALSYVRAVAYLPDDNSSEDHVFINAPPGLEEIDIQLVELYASVTDRNGRPVDDLTADDFRILEDGVPQTIRRFEQVDDLPIHAAILLDVSASMEDRLEAAQEAALSFYESTISPKDRAALVTFNDRPHLRAKFTNELIDLGSGLAGLEAERGTALWDSVVFSLYYFNGIKGQRALLVLSDGKDESSRFEFDEVLEFARRAGVTIYTIGLDLPFTDREARRRLGRLAEETGGRSYFVEEASELMAIYSAIEEEVRSQYFIAYQSTNSETDGQFRTVEIEVTESGLEATTIRGYYP